MTPGEISANDYDFLMPSSERRLDSIPKSATSLATTPFIEDTLRKDVTSPSSSSLRQSDSKLKPVVSESTSPDPRWPHLHRWRENSPPSLIPPSKNLPSMEPQSSSPGAGQNNDTFASVVPTTLHHDSCSLSAVQSHDVGSVSISVTEGSKTVIIPVQKESLSSVPETSRVSLLPISKGAWEKPLAIHSAPLHHLAGGPLLNSDKIQWPALSSGSQGNTRPICSSALPLVSTISQCSESEAASLKALSKEYPWAARMNQSLRNLHRVTIPEYLEDGTPKVRIPSHVLLGGLENQKEYVVGQFYRCSAPSRGFIQSIVTRIWGKKCRIFIRKLGESSYLFHIPDESTRKWVIQRGLWHVDDCLMFVSPWSPSDTISVPEISTVPVWLTLNNIPDQLYSIIGIKWIASGIGEPIVTEKPWLDPTLMGKAKILVEVKLDKAFPQRVALTDSSDSITMVEVLYSWLPSNCSRCGHIGHKASRCLLLCPNISSHATVTPTVKVNELSNASGPSRLVKSTSPASSSTLNHGDTTVMQASLERMEKTIGIVPVQSSTLIPFSSKDIVHTASGIHATISTISLPIATTSMTPNKKAEMASPSESLIAAHAIHKSRSISSMNKNRFSELESSEDEEDTTILEEDTTILDEEDTTVLDADPQQSEFMTPSGQRILRERPVKPSVKVKDMQWKVPTGGRGNRGRGRSGRG